MSDTCTNSESPVPAADSVSGSEWAQRLCDWYEHNHRRLPWRESPSPYRVWVSEIMLQQTRVATVVPYFERFLSRFPTIADLATANQESVLKAWEGLGYYARARNLHRAARMVVREFDGELPSDNCELRKLPGLGAYAAAAVASIAFGRAVPAVDGNVLRVVARFQGLDQDVRSARVRREAAGWVSAAMAVCPPATVTQAVMELGALICVPRTPLCSQCPIASFCAALRWERTHQLPVRTPRRTVPHLTVAVAVIPRNRRFLIARRPEEAMLGGLWEFPGGKQEPGESLEQTVVREVREETGLDVAVQRLLGTVQHAYSHFRVTLSVFRCLPRDGQQPRTSAANTDLAWVTLEEIAAYPIPKASHKILALLRDADV